MRRLLLVCSTFPPQADVGGLRPAMFAKYLPEFGWQPYILTRGWPQGDPHCNQTQDIGGLPGEDFIRRVIFGAESEERALRRFGLLERGRAFFMPELKSSFGIIQALELLEPTLWPNVRFDAILGTVPEDYPLRIAATVSKARGVPWIADFRDLVEQEEGMDFSFREKLVRLRGKIRRGWLLKSARLATVVSKTHQCILKRQYRLPVEVVYNGYDSTLSPARFLPDTRSKLRIVYVGRLLSQWYRDPSVLFGGLDRLFSSGRMRPDDVEVCFYGTEPGILEGILGRFGCHHVVRIEPRVNHSEIPHVLARASVLLVLTNRGRQGVLTTKLFEYLPMKKPILCVPGDGGELDELLRETRVGCSCADAESVGDTLWHWHSQWKNNGAIPVNANARCIERFSRRRQTRVFAELLDRVVEAAERGRATLA